ncbi:hypothetical protein C0Q70_16228 [Pomacea canaliculata]|uniref:dual-specificity kinase n=2 Tax=Pomacea canaliculata TaxID=400727 RepID=A0A2T7NP73_POMCA|nr:hypothetical protein C0Q70_16228 [Pomacea canaliculata]
MDKTSSSTKRSTLRRSRTITCNVYPATRPVQDRPVDRTREPSPNDETSPKSSCQALRHAVSALTRLDDFICEKIGAGFFSEVFKVTHRTTGQVMALKMNTMTSNRHNMLREVQLLNRLSHPNILRFMGVCVHEGQLHALTEFISGGSLEQLLQEEEELPWTQRIHLTHGVARGLHYLHSMGFMHRDLTSKNILIKKEDNRSYHAVIADFGLAAKIPDPLNKEKLPVVGSPYWMAPEVLHGDFYNERADIFSLGIIMCEITARISADPDVMPRMQNFGVDYVALSEMIDYCPLDYLQLAFKCCQVDPSKRPEGSEIIDWLEKIYRNLQNDIVTQQEKEKTERSGHKRSRSEDNILQANDSEADTSNEDIIVTPLLIGQVMSRDDPSYEPSSTNPFAAIQRFRHGRKLLGTSMDYSTDLISPATPLTPPSTPGCPDFKCARNRDHTDGMAVRRCQSLPSSPVLLRRAAEKLHQESLHGSARYCSQQHQSGLHAMRARSKSTVLGEALAARLQRELSPGLIIQPVMSTFIPESQQEAELLETEGTSVSNYNSSCVRGVNGLERNTQDEVLDCLGQSPGIRSSVPGAVYITPPSMACTAANKRSLRKTKQKSLDEDCDAVIHHPQRNGHGPRENGNYSRVLSSKGNAVASSAEETRDKKVLQLAPREVSPASMRSSCESFMSIDEHDTSTPSSLSSYSEAND